MKKMVWNLSCIVLLLLTVLLLWNYFHKSRDAKSGFEDEIKQVDLDKIYLGGGKTEVSFSDVILTAQEETRKLIVSEQSGTVTAELTDRIIEQLDFDFLKKTQKVSYMGKGYFVVDLDNLKPENITDDSENKVVIIRIKHAYLKAIEIDPNSILIDEVKEGLLARGDIELSVRDYNVIEKELRTRLEEKFNTVANGQEADDIALKMVRDIYVPVVKAVNEGYDVKIEFQ